MADPSNLFVQSTTSLHEALAKLEATGAGVLLFVDPKNLFKRTITDGDIRRLLLSGASLQDTIASLPEVESEILLKGFSVHEAKAKMDNRDVNHLPVLNEIGMAVDLVNRKDLVEPILLSPPHMGSAEQEYVNAAFETNWLAPLGPNVDAFEMEMATLLGVNACSAVSSGTSAIHLGLRLLDVDAGDKVFCSSLTFVGSAAPILYQGAEPIFIDSDAKTWNMCPRALESAFKSAVSENWLPKAVIVVNLYGQSADLDEILAICNHYKVPVLEDAAESLGAKYRGKASGTIGKLGVFSFNGNKIITTSGGGMLVSNDIELITKSRFLSTQAKDGRDHYHHTELGYNYRMSNILAGVGRGQLSVLSDRVRARRQLFETYCSALKDFDCINWMPEPSWSYSTRWLSVCLVRPSGNNTSPRLIKYLNEEKIEARRVWKPMHLQPLFENARYFKSENDSVSDQIFEKGMCLPSGSSMTAEQINRTIAAVQKFLTK